MLLSLNHGNVDSAVSNAARCMRHDPHVICIISAAGQRMRKFFVFVVFLQCLTTSVVNKLEPLQLPVVVRIPRLTWENKQGSSIKAEVFSFFGWLGGVFSSVSTVK